jgi:hypothetical protein
MITKATTPRPMRTSVHWPTRTSTDVSGLKFPIDISFLLATVICGFAISEALVILNDNFIISNDLSYGWINIDWSVFAGTAAVIITIIRFFHGNVLWYYRCYSSGQNDRSLLPNQRALVRLSSYYVHVLQYILFYFVATSIKNSRALGEMFAIISAVDVFWTGLCWSRQTDKILKNALGSWAILNAISGVLCMIAINIDSLKETTIYWILLGIYSLSTLVDYFVNKNLFFNIPLKKGR